MALNTSLRTVGKNTLAQFLVKGALSTATLLATIIIVQLAGFETLGSFTKVITFVTIFYLFVDLGLNQIFLKTFFSDVEKRLTSLITLRFLLGCALIPIVILIAYLLPTGGINAGFSGLERAGIVFFSATLITFGLQLSYQALLQKRLNYMRMVIPNIIGAIVLLPLVYYGALTENILLILFSYVISGLIVSLALSIETSRLTTIQSTLNGFSEFSKRLIRQSLPLSIALAVNLLYAKVDIFMLTYMTTTTQVGVYGFAYRFFELAITLPLFVSNSLYPILLAAPTTQYASLFKKYLGVLLFLGILASIALSVVALTLPFFGNMYHQSSLPLLILAASLPSFFLTSLLQWNFIIREKFRFLILCYTIGLVLNVILNLAAIEWWGVAGAAATTLLCETIVLVLMLLALKRR